MTDKLDDLFWPARTQLPEIKWKKIEGHENWIDQGEEFDELSHIQEQYNIKCDELKIAMMENRRLSLIIINNGLENLLEIEDGEEDNEESDEQEDSNES